jgi:peptide/nickel transport system permease protein
MTGSKDSPARFLTSPLARWGVGVAGTLALLALCAPWVAPYDPFIQIDPAAGRHLPPGSRRLAVQLDGDRWLLADAARVTPQGLAVDRLGRTELHPLSQVANLETGEIRDVRLFLLGTDRYGRDLWSRLLYGARVSLTIGLLAAALSLTLGIAVGGLAAVLGGAADALLMRGVDGLLVFPRLFLVILLAALFDVTQWTVILLLGGTGWMAASRLVRSEILSLQRREFVLAARAVGQRPTRIFFRHLLPNAVAPLVVETTLRIGNIILVEAALSFLGLGIQPPNPSWGNMVADGSDVLTSAWWVALFPGLAIALAVIAFNLIGDGLRDQLDPRRRALSHADGRVRLSAA